MSNIPLILACLALVAYQGFCYFMDLRARAERHRWLLSAQAEEDEKPKRDEYREEFEWTVDGWTVTIWRPKRKQKPMPASDVTSDSLQKETLALTHDLLKVTQHLRERLETEGAIEAQRDRVNRLKEIAPRTNVIQGGFLPSDFIAPMSWDL